MLSQIYNFPFLFIFSSSPCLCAKSNSSLLSSSVSPCLRGHHPYLALILSSSSSLCLCAKFFVVSSQQVLDEYLHANAYEGNASRYFSPALQARTNALAKLAAQKTEQERY